MELYKIILLIHYTLLCWISFIINIIKYNLSSQFFCPISLTSTRGTCKDNISIRKDCVYNVVILEKLCFAFCITVMLRNCFIVFACTSVKLLYFIHKIIVEFNEFTIWLITIVIQTKLIKRFRLNNLIVYRLLPPV